MAADYAFTEDEMLVDESFGYPKAYARLCRDRTVCPYNHGPPFTFTPYALQQNEVLKSKPFGFPFVSLELQNGFWVLIIGQIHNGVSGNFESGRVQCVFLEHSYRICLKEYELLSNSYFYRAISDYRFWFCYPSLSFFLFCVGFFNVIWFSLQAVRASDFDQMFPILDPKAKPTAKPKMFVSLMWKQLNHLG